jgi:very-short-patch-repair endonuclease
MAQAAGLSDRQLRHPAVARLSRDTYLPRALSRDPSHRVAAVLLTAPAGAVLSHLTAAVLWGLQIPSGRGGDVRVDLTVPMASRAESRADRRIHRMPIAVEEVTRRGAFTLTTPSRTWRDLAAVLQPGALLAVTDQLIAGLCTPADLQRQMDRRPYGRGIARARAVLPVADPRSESPMESVLRWLIRAAGLPAPELQFAVLSAAGVFLGRADMAWPDRKVIVEFDGNVHRERDVFVNDLRRQNELVAAGWTILRFSSADVLGRPEQVIAAIRAALRS